MAVTTYTFDGETPGTTVTAGSHGILEVTGTPSYEIAEWDTGIDIADSEKVEWAFPQDYSASFYIQIPAGLGDDNWRFALVEKADVSGFQSMLRGYKTAPGRKFAVTAGTTLGEQSTAQYVPGTTYRVDVQSASAGNAITWRVYNMDGSVFHEFAPVTAPSTGTVLNLGVQGNIAGYAAKYDTLRIADGLQWFDNYAPIQWAYWDGAAEQQATSLTMWDGASEVPLTFDQVV